jgi:hypothetical protein
MIEEKERVDDGQQRSCGPFRTEESEQEKLFVGAGPNTGKK